MAKKKIPNEELIIHINKYFYEINHEQIKCLKYTNIAEYLSKVTNSVMMEYDIRRNKEITDYIHTLKSQARKNIEKDAIVFVPLEVTNFINKNNNPASLKKALVERDQYYKSICESASTIAGEDELLNKKISDLITVNKALKADIQEKADQLDAAHEEVKILKSQLKRFKDILEDSVYPEIANELLREVGLLKDGEEIVNTASYPVIEDTDSIIGFIKKNEEKYSENKVIQGLFDKI